MHNPPTLLPLGVFVDSEDKRRKYKPFNLYYYIWHKCNGDIRLLSDAEWFCRTFYDRSLCEMSAAAGCMTTGVWTKLLNRLGKQGGWCTDAGVPASPPRKLCEQGLADGDVFDCWAALRDTYCSNMHAVMLLDSSHAFWKCHKPREWYLTYAEQDGAEVWFGGLHKTPYPRDIARALWTWAGYGHDEYEFRMRLSNNPFKKNRKPDFTTLVKELDI